MCLYPTLRRNKKYEKNKKNGGIIPPVLDTRVLYVPTACGNCLECRKKKAREWTIRLQEDIKGQNKKRFITLTLSNESYKELYAISEKKTLEKIKKLEKLGLDEHDKKKRLTNEDIKLRGYKKENEIITLAVRRFMERWRKEHKVSLRHWLVSELGGSGTENIHLHGIVYTDDLEKVEKTWKYGYVWKGKMINGKLQNYVNDRTINYMVKYISKIDFKHEYYKPIILNSAGIGANYEKSRNFEDNRYIAGKTNEMLRLDNGRKVALPIYYRNKRYTEEEREKLWIEKLDKNIRFVMGIPARTDEDYYRLLRDGQRQSVALGYTGNVKNWKRQEYELKRREMLSSKRRANASGGPYAGGG